MPDPRPEPPALGDRLAGVLAPLVTPFDPAGGAPDLAAFARNVRAHRAAGLAGVLVAGSSGEAALLDDAEREALVAAAREASGPGGLVLAGVGAESTAATARRARAAAAAGADAVLVVAPHYYGRRMTEAALAAHFLAVAEASPRPVLLYNIPAYAHLVLAPALVARLAAHPNVAGMKDSAGDLPVLREYLAAGPSGFRVLTGHAATFGPALAMGAAGGILAAALFAPALALAVYRAHRAGAPADGAPADGETADGETAQAALGAIARDVVAGLGPPGLKCAMDLVGLDGGPPRAPLLPCDAAERALVAERLAGAGLLRAAAAA